MLVQCRGKGGREEITDIARYKDAERTDYIIANWLRNRNTIEFLGIWERLNNPGFNPIEFDGIQTRGIQYLFLWSQVMCPEWPEWPQKEKG